jgi:hypothetical protein
MDTTSGHTNNAWLRSRFDDRFWRGRIKDTKSRFRGDVNCDFQLLLYGGDHPEGEYDEYITILA